VLVLSWWPKKVENMIVASADLSNSDKTDGFLKQTKQFTKGDFSGGFLQAGVLRVDHGRALQWHGASRRRHPACGTFFVFSDYMKPAVRLAALMACPSSTSGPTTRSGSAKTPHAPTRGAGSTNSIDGAPQEITRDR